MPRRVRRNKWEGRGLNPRAPRVACALAADLAAVRALRPPARAWYTVLRLDVVALCASRLVVIDGMPRWHSCVPGACFHAAPSRATHCLRLQALFQVGQPQYGRKSAASDVITRTLYLPPRFARSFHANGLPRRLPGPPTLGGERYNLTSSAECLGQSRQHHGGDQS